MKILFFATNSYPYGKGEPLIPNQINFLSKEFDKIIIVSSNPDTRATYKLPQNVVSYIVPFNLTRFQKIIGILNFFSKNVRIERQFAKETYKIKNSFSILKVKGKIESAKVEKSQRKRISPSQVKWETSKEIPLKNPTLFWTTIFPGLILKNNLFVPFTPNL